MQRYPRHRRARARIALHSVSFVGTLARRKHCPFLSQLCANRLRWNVGVWRGSNMRSHGEDAFMGIFTKFFNGLLVSFLFIFINFVSLRLPTARDLDGGTRFGDHVRKVNSLSQKHVNVHGRSF